MVLKNNIDFFLEIFNKRLKQQTWSQSNIELHWNEFIQLKDFPWFFQRFSLCCCFIFLVNMITNDIDFPKDIFNKKMFIIFMNNTSKTFILFPSPSSIKSISICLLSRFYLCFWDDRQHTQLSTNSLKNNIKTNFNSYSKIRKNKRQKIYKIRNTWDLIAF